MTKEPIDLLRLGPQLPGAASRIMGVQIFRALHFHEAGDSARKLKTAIAARIQVLRLNGGGRHETHLPFIKRVNERYETLGFIAIGSAEFRNVVDKDRAETVSNFQIIRGA